MRYIISDSTDAYFNLASEEYLLKHTEEEIFYLWRNDNAIIVGTNQNALSEINVDYVKEKNIKVVRRLTGGGAVYHDLGNLNYTFIENNKKNFNDFRGFCEPITKALIGMGVEAEFSGRNDMTIEGKKFSGNAKSYYNNKILQHGTLLFDSTLPNLSQALKLNPLKYRDKAVKSISSRVTNITEHLKHDITLQEFEKNIVDHVRTLYADAEVYELTTEDIAAINKLVDEKYGTWDWNFGYSPKYNFQKGIRTSGGHVEVNLEVRKGQIENVKIFGDFFNTSEVSELENMLKGAPHEREKIKTLLSTVGIEKYLNNVTVEEFLEGMF